MAVGTVALLVLPAHPILLDALVAEHRLRAAQAGVLATLEILTLALGAALGPRWLASGRIPAKTAMAMVLVTAFDAATGLSGGGIVLMAMRCAAGLFEGMALSATIVTLIRADRPDRLNGIFLAVSTIPQAALAVLLPIAIVPRYGSTGCFIVLGAAGLAGVGAALALPRTVDPHQPQGDGEPVWHLGVITGLLAIMLQNASIGGAFDFLELLARGRGLGPGLVAGALGGCLVLQVVGAFAVSFWGARFKIVQSLLVGSIAQAALILVLALGSGATAFLVAALGFGLFWMAMSPFQVRLLIVLEKSRQAAQAQSPATLAGLCLGPTICGFAVRGTDVSGAFLCSAGLMLAAVLLYLLGGVQMRRGRAKEQIGGSVRR